MSLAPDLLPLLADPETHEALTEATPAQVALLLQAAAAGRAKRRDGKAGPQDFEGALLSQGGRVAYLIQGGIPNLLVDERLELESALAEG